MPNKDFPAKETTKLAFTAGFTFTFNGNNTQAEIQEYYRNKHHLHCFIGYRPNIQKWDCHVYDLRLTGKEYAAQRPMLASTKDIKFDSYEEALEHGLIDAGKKIIKLHTK